MIKELYRPEDLKVSLTNSIVTAIVMACVKHDLCPASWTFVGYSNMGTARNSYHEYALIVLDNDRVDWKYIWHTDNQQEKEPYSDELMIRRVKEFRK